MDHQNKPMIVFWNCSHGLSSKISFVRDYIHQHRPMIMMISECELSRDDEINSGYFHVKGYTMITSNTRVKKKDAKLKSRLCALIRDDIHYSRKEALEGQEEIIVIDTDCWRIVGVYCPFKLQEGETTTTNFDRLIDTLKNATICQGKGVYCGGDFNVDWLKDSAQKNALQQWAFNSDLHQTIDSITRYRSVKTDDGYRAESSLLDHVYVPSTLLDKVSTCHTTTHLSDHELITLYPYASPKIRPHSKNAKVIIRDWRKYDKSKLCEYISSSSPPNYQAVTQALTVAFEKLVPLRVARFKPEHGEFANAKIAKLRKKRDRLLKEYKKTNFEQYLHASRIVTYKMKKAIKYERVRVVQKKLETPNPKAFWSTINNMLGKRSFDNEWSINNNGTSITQSQEIAELFVDYFQQKVINLAGTLPGRPQVHSTGPPLQFTLKELEETLARIKSKHCYGPNGIPLRIVKDYCTILPKQALDLLNNLAKNGLDTSQKNARILPLHKKGKKDEITNYRPIANLCSIAKVFEKLLLNRLVTETTGLEGSYQHGFRRAHSTTTALLQLQNSIAKHLNSGEQCLVYSVDLSAAFDVLRPDIFMDMYRDKLSHGLAKSLADFMDERSITCEIKGIRSTPKNLPIGCVQGSILGPRIFTLYMGTLSTVLGCSDVVGYADDTYVTIGGSTIEALLNRTKSVSLTHVSYLRSLGMVVNTSKTEAVIFGKNDNSNTTVCFAGTDIKTGTTMKALGVTLQSDLKWDGHLASVIPKSQSKLSLLRKIRPLLTMEQFLTISTSQVFSTAYYATPVWLNCTLSSKLWKKITSFHYRVMRVACRDFKARKKRILIDKQCKRATPKMWGDYISASTAIKITRDSEPRLLADDIRSNWTIEKRRANPRFFDDSIRQPGRHIFSNRLKHLNDLQNPWHHPPPSNDIIRVLLKKHFNFDFETTQPE